MSFDAAVAGGGAVGCALALALARDGFDVALVEPEPPPRFDPSAAHDLRTYAMSPASIAMLTRLGTWDLVAARRISPYTRMKVWSDDASRGIAFDAALIGERVLGAIVEDRALRDALWQAVASSARIAHHAATLEGFEVERGGARLALSGGGVLRARVAIAADGARSTLRRLAGLDAAPAPATQRALVANVKTERPHESTAWQRFTADGPLAFLPLSNGECSIVWTVPDARASVLLALDDTQFRHELGSAFQHRLGEIVACSARAAIPVGTALAPRYVGDRVALVGDSAHVVLPLAGQGLNLGLLDAAALADVLRGEARGDPGSVAVLERYERWRRADNVLAANAFEGLDRLFRAGTPGIAWLRDTGLSLADRITPVKRGLALQASGFAGRTPQLSRRLG